MPFFHSMGVRGRSGRIAGIVGAFQASDGFFILQAVRDHHIALLIEAIGHPEWADDPRFADRFGYAKHQEDVVKPAIEEWARDKTILEACSALTASGVAAGPCFSAEHIIEDPHVHDHNMIIEVDRPDADEPLLVVGNPVKMSKVAEGPVRRWPTLGEHTDSILSSELGLDADALGALREAGAIGGR